jgi:tetratricopeptide (TPR) repeat protein
MHKEINLNGIRAIWRDFKLTICFFVVILIIISTLFLFYFIEDSILLTSSLSIIDIASIAIGLFGLFTALWSIQSTTISFKEIQADYWNTRGIDKLNIKKYHDAHQAYDKAIAIDPLSIKYCINKASALLEQGSIYREKSLLVNALNIINDVIEKGPKYPTTYKKNTSQERKAEQEYANAIKTKCDILFQLANVSEPISKSTQVLQYYSNFPHIRFKSHRLNCDSISNINPRAELPSRQALLECAIKASNAAIDKYPKGNPEIPGAYVSKGNALKSLGKYDDAIAAYDKAITSWETIGRDPNSVVAWIGKGQTLVDKGNAFASNGNHNAAASSYEEALEAYEKAIELKPDSAKIWLNKGNVLQAQKKYIEAIHSYDKAIQFDPLNQDACIQRGNALIDQAKDLDAVIAGRIWSYTSDTALLQRSYCYIEALRSYDIAIDISPHDKVAWDNKGNVLRYQGKYDDGIQAHDKAIMLDPHYALAWGNKGITLIHQGKYEDAIEILKVAISLDAQQASAWNSMGSALAYQGKYEDASKAFDEAIRIDPKNAAALNNKGNILKLLANCKK